jgi:hemolysin activation/secretion protein
MSLRRIGWIGVLLVLSGAAADAQVRRPGDQPLPPEEFLPEEPEPAPLELPPVPPVPEDAEALSIGLRVFVRVIRVEGSTVFSAEELAAVAEPYVGRTIRSEELIAARDAITQLYIARGYITSGALIPDQTVEDGVVRIAVMEGRLAEVRVEGARGFRDGYFRSRLLRAGAAPVNVLALERQLQRFQRNPRIERVQAQLLPGARRGESVLVLAVEEAAPYTLSLTGDNDRNPAIGTWGGRAIGSFSNLIGYDDRLSGWFDGSEGLREYALAYEVPLVAYDTRLGVHYRRTETEVVEDDFEDLDIESESLTYGVALRHPFYRDADHDLWLGVVGERRESRSTLLGIEFCFPPVVDCDASITVVRALQEWTWRTRRDVVAARSTLSLGLDALGATTLGEVDGQYFAWLMQTQWAHRFSERLWGTELLARADLQLANDPLLPIEKFALGGLESVRGYRKNRIVRDSGVFGSFELRIPLLRDAFGRPLLQFAPFADVGHGWDQSPGLPSQTLASLGVGLRASPWPWLLAEVYWGSNLTGLSDPGDDLQDEGFYARVTLIAF